MKSCSMSVISNPAALNRPGTSGTTTRLIPIVCAELHGVYRPAAAERDQREFTHVAPALRGNRLDRTRHRRIGDYVNTPRGVRDAASERGCDVLANRPASRAPASIGIAPPSNPAGLR